MELPVKLLYLLSTLVLSASYIAAWFQIPISIHFEWASPFVFHLASAGSSVLLSFFSDLSVLFYFIGTGVWMKDQAKELAKHDKKRGLEVWDIYEKSNQLKGRAFPFATFGVFFGILTFVFGGALQVGAVPYWVHPVLATLLVLVHWVGLPFVFPAINKNFDNLNKCSDLVDNVKT